MMEHKTRGVDDCLVDANGNDFGRHDVFDSHCPILNLELAEKAPHYSERMTRQKRTLAR
jgi:hypothetical protein